MKIEVNGIAIAWILLGLGCALAAADTIDDWVAENMQKNEKVMCKREVGGEYFFLAQAEDKVKVGSRLDMTQYRQTHVFIVGWKFRNENDESLTVKVRPVPVKDKYLQVKGRIFAEQVQYQTVRLSGSKTMRVAIDVKKCPTSACDRQRTLSKEEQQYMVELCTVRLGE